MKTRLLWIVILAVGLPALYLGITQPQVSSIPSNIRDPIADLKPPGPPPLEPPALVIPPMPTVLLPISNVTPVTRMPTSRIEPIVSAPPEVPIQNGSTIDFSTGVPMVRSYGKDQDALETALREIAETTKGATIKAEK